MTDRTDPNEGIESTRNDLTDWNEPIDGQTSDDSQTRSFARKARAFSSTIPVPRVDTAENGPITVLVVDDEKKVADAYALRLQERFDVQTAYGGEEALKIIDQDVDVVLLDRRMRDVSGDKVLREIRDREPDCRIIMITEIDPEFDIIGMPFDDYVCRPTDGDELLSTIDHQVRIIAYERLSEYFQLASERAVHEAVMARDGLDQNHQQTLPLAHHLLLHVTDAPSTGVGGNSA